MFDRYPGFLAKTLAATIGGWLVFAGFAIWDVRNSPSQDIAQALLPATIAIAAVFSMLVVYPMVMALIYWALTQQWTHRLPIWTVAGAIGGAVVTGLFGLLMSGGYADATFYAAGIGTACGCMTAAIGYTLFRSSLR